MPTALLTPSEAQALPPVIFNANSTRFGQLLANGVPFSFRGARWGGTETELMVPGGLDKHSLDHYMAFLQAEGFNSIRFGFDHERMLRNAITPEGVDAIAEAPELGSLPYAHLFLSVAKAAARRGLLVVLGCDRLRVDAPPGHKDSGTWASGTLTEELALRSWQRLAHVLCTQWNVVRAP